MAGLPHSDVFEDLRNEPARDLIPAYLPNSTSIGNKTIDVMLKGCFTNFSTIACIRNGVIAILALLSAALCIVKVGKLHLSKHPTFHQYVIFYCASIECFLCATHWIVGKYVQVDFIMQYLKLLQFLFVMHLYWTLATRALRKEVLANRVVVPVLMVAWTYFTVVVIWACIKVQSSWIECFQPFWLALSSAELALVQLFLIAGIYITRRLNEISTLDSVRREQKRDLWMTESVTATPGDYESDNPFAQQPKNIKGTRQEILIVVFEVSAFCGFVYDVLLRALGNEDNGCSGVFLHRDEIYSPIFGFFMVLKFLVPIWAMWFVFQPIESAPDQEDLLPAIHEDGSYSSVFVPSYDGGTYRPLYHPGGDLQAVDNGDLSSSPSSPGSSTPIFAPFRRTASNLATIHEERPEADHNTNRKPPLYAAYS